MKGAPPLLNSALWQDLQLRLATNDLIEWLEVESERVAALGRTHQNRIAFVGELLRDRRIATIQPKPFISALATIVSGSRGYEIFYRPFQQLEDQRFWIAHEIAHTFWYAPDGLGRPLSPLQSAVGDDSTIEWLCNRGAAAILLPRLSFSEMSAQMPGNLHSISSIAKQYLVPERLVARRLLHELAGKTSAVLAVRIEAKDGQSHGVVRWMADTPHRTRGKRQVRGRLVPCEMLPNISSQTTSEVELDGRWWLLLNHRLGRQRTRPLSQERPLPTNKGWVGRDHDTWYLALPALSLSDIQVARCEPPNGD